MLSIFQKTKSSRWWLACTSGFNSSSSSCPFVNCKLYENIYSCNLAFPSSSLAVYFVQWQWSLPFFSPYGRYPFLIVHQSGLIEKQIQFYCDHNYALDWPYLAAIRQRARRPWSVKTVAHVNAASTFETMAFKKIAFRSRKEPKNFHYQNDDDKLRKPFLSIHGPARPAR